MSDDVVYDIHAVLEHYGWDLPAPRTGWVTVKCHEHPDSHASKTTILTTAVASLRPFAKHKPIWIDTLSICP